MSEPLVHHRQPAFVELMREAADGLRWLHNASREHDCLVLSCSGTGSMEAAIIAVASRGDRMIAVQGGKFGERWGDVGETYGLDVHRVELEWGQAATAEDVGAAIDAGEAPQLVVLTVNETSTGTLHDYRAIARTVREKAPDAVLIYDCITALGVVDIDVQALDVDIVACGSQKAFGLPPGMATLCVSPRAWAAAERSDIPKYYFDLLRERDKQRKHQTAFTSPITLVVGLCEVLSMMREEGREGLFARHARVADAVRGAVGALGLGLFSSAPSNALTAIEMPEAIDGQAVVKTMRDTFGVAIAGGQDHVKGKIVRIGHLGFVDTKEVLYGLKQFERTLASLGYDVTPGTAVAAAAALL